MGVKMAIGGGGGVGGWKSDEKGKTNLARKGGSQTVFAGGTSGPRPVLSWG